jgi:hypothetical protein
MGSAAPDRRGNIIASSRGKDFLVFMGDNP